MYYTRKKFNYYYNALIIINEIIIFKINFYNKFLQQILRQIFQI